MSDYRVRFEVFEGPLDLLLYLIRKEEVDIYEVNLTKIATEFIAYLNLMQELDLDVAGEFLVMAATLMLIKSRELLPRDQRPEDPADTEDEADDPRWELIRQLVEYKKFKDAAARLQDLEDRAEDSFPRTPGRLELPEVVAPRGSEANLFDLLGAVNAVLKRFAQRGGEARDVFEDKWTVSEKIESLLGAVRQRMEMRFSELFHEATSRAEVVVTFLALLELIRLRLVAAIQPSPFSDISIEWTPPSPANPTPPAMANPVEKTAPLTRPEKTTSAPEPSDASSVPASEPSPISDANPAQWN